jgi:hypothetical protein
LGRLDEVDHYNGRTPGVPGTRVPPLGGATWNACKRWSRSGRTWCCPPHLHPM